MDALVCIECTSGAAARGFVEDAGAGSLWGVNLGTTSKAVAVGSYLVVGCTPTRASDLSHAAPGNPTVVVVDDVPGVTQMSHDQAMFFGYGQMDE